MPPVIEKEGCTACGICIEVCPEDVFYGSEKGKHLITEKGELPIKVTFPDECWHCAACVIDCPPQVIRLYIPLPMRL